MQNKYMFDSNIFYNVIQEKIPTKGMIWNVSKWNQCTWCDDDENLSKQVEKYNGKVINLEEFLKLCRK